MNRRAQLLSANDSVEAIEALIKDRKIDEFPHIYWAHFDLRGKDPTNPMPMLSKTFLRLSRATGRHIWPILAATAFPWMREHAHSIFCTDKPLQMKDIKKSYRWGFLVCEKFQMKLGGASYILTGHIQQPSFYGVFCPNLHACSQTRTDTGIIQVCKHQKNVPLHGHRRDLYWDSRVYKALRVGEFKAHGQGHLLEPE